MRTPKSLGVTVKNFGARDLCIPVVDHWTAFESQSDHCSTWRNGNILTYFVRTWWQRRYPRRWWPRHNSRTTLWYSDPLTLWPYRMRPVTIMALNHKNHIVLGSFAGQSKFVNRKLWGPHKISRREILGPCQRNKSRAFSSALPRPDVLFPQKTKSKYR